MRNSINYAELMEFYSIKLCKRFLKNGIDEHKDMVLTGPRLKEKLFSLEKEATFGCFNFRRSRKL
jgi:hypothetical protein